MIDVLHPRNTRQCRPAVKPVDRSDVHGHMELQHITI